MRAAGAGLLAILLSSGCAPSAGPLGPDGTGGVPIGRSPFVRPGTFSYDYADLREGRNGGLLVDFAVTNGTHRDYASVIAVVAVYGEGTKRVSQRVQIGTIRKGGNRRGVARFGEVPFEVIDFSIEIVSAVSF